MKARTWTALAALTVTGLLMLPLTACIQVVKKPAEDPKPDAKPAVTTPAAPGTPAEPAVTTPAAPAGAPTK